MPWFACSANEPKPLPVDSQTRQVRSADDRDITYYLDRAPDATGIPILLIVDGSGCIGQQRRGFGTLYFPDAGTSAAYARLRVEKPGVAGDAQPGSACSDDFAKHYTIHNRVLDHLRVLQHLKAHATWWNGDVLLWGWSDGGDIAAQLAAYHPGVRKSVLGGMGGGFSMAEHFEYFWVCPRTMDQVKRDECLAALRDHFGQMEDNPTWKQTWSGEDNTWRVWGTRLRTRLSPVLADVSSPFLIVHGARDHDSTPVESARELVRHLREQGNTAFSYWEVPGMEHGPNSLPTREHSRALNDAMLQWLLSKDASSSPPAGGIDQPVIGPAACLASR